MPGKGGKGKGGKNRRRGKNTNDEEKRELVLKEEGQEYAEVVKMLGSGRLEAKCFDGKTRLGKIRGNMRKKVWINQGDMVLCSLRDFEDDKCDVILKYSAEEARKLQKQGHLPDTAGANDQNGLGAEEEEDCAFDFEDI